MPGPGGSARGSAEAPRVPALPPLPQPAGSGEPAASASPGCRGGEERGRLLRGGQRALEKP